MMHSLRDPQAPIHLLHLEDSPADAALIRMTIEAADPPLQVSIQCVSTKAGFETALREGCVDLILCDYRLPAYDGEQALQAAQELCPHVPVVMVTGELGEERAIETLKAGATDYVLKDRLKRLVPSIRRALKEAELKRLHKQDLETLRRTRAELQEAQRLGQIGSWVWHVQTGMLMWSPETYRIYGVAPATFTPSFETFMPFIHPEDRGLISGKIAEIISTGKSADFDFRIVRPDGAVRTLNTKVELAERDPEGRPVVVRGTNQDVTERKRAEEAIEAVHGQIQSIIDNTPALVYAFDLEERFLIVNAALAALLKSTPQAMLGQRRQEFMPKEDAKWHEANDRQVVEAGRAIEFEEYSQLQGRSITWLTTKFPLRDVQGKIYAVAGISTEITERKRAEEAQRRSLEMLHLVAETARQPILVVSSEGRIEFANSLGSRLLGYADGALAGEHVAKFVVPPSAPAHARLLEDLRTHAPRPLVTTLQVRPKDSPVVWMTIEVTRFSAGSDREQYLVRIEPRETAGAERENSGKP